MADIEGLTREEIRELILEQIRDAGVDTDAIEIEVDDGPRVILKGAVESEGDRCLVKKAIMDIVGIDDLEDDMVIMEEPEDPAGECDVEGGLYNRDDEDELTEDAFVSIEDGIPYVPPDRPLHDESDEGAFRKKRKRK